MECLATWSVTCASTDQGGTQRRIWPPFFRRRLAAPPPTRRDAELAAAVGRRARRRGRAGAPRAPAAAAAAGAARSRRPAGSRRTLPASDRTSDETASNASRGRAPRRTTNTTTTPSTTPRPRDPPPLPHPPTSSPAFPRDRPLTAFSVSYFLLILMLDHLLLAAAPPPALPLHAWAALPRFIWQVEEGGSSAKRWTPLPRKPRRERNLGRRRGGGPLISKDQHQETNTRDHHAHSWTPRAVRRPGRSGRGLWDAPTGAITSLSRARESGGRGRRSPRLPQIPGRQSPVTGLFWISRSTCGSCASG